MADLLTVAKAPDTLAKYISRRFQGITGRVKLDGGSGESGKKGFFP